MSNAFEVQSKSAMKDLLFLVTTKKDAQGQSGTMVAVDDNEGNLAVAHNMAFKSCVADEAGTVTTLISQNRSHFSGVSHFSSGDYLAVAQASKPLIHIYQWGKPQPLYHIATQEILSSLTSDPSGEYLYGGSRKGYIYVWHVVSGELLTVWQAHFQSVNRLIITDNGHYLISGSDDGAVKVWNIAQILDATIVTSSSLKMSTANQRTVTPYRSWHAHTLGVTDLVAIDSFSVLRVISCSLDRSMHLYDVHANRSMTKHSLPQPLQSIAINATFDYIFCGSTSGSIYRIDCSVLAAGFSASKSHVVHSGISSHSSLLSLTAGSSSANADANSTDEVGHGVACIDAHSLAVTAIICMPDNQRVISTSEDGSMKMWSLHTKQLLKEIQPLNKAPLTNCKVMCVYDLSRDCVGLCVY
jgi:pre-rRNA-processing protein IPI3